MWLPLQYITFMKDCGWKQIGECQKQTARPYNLIWIKKFLSFLGYDTDNITIKWGGKREMDEGIGDGNFNIDIGF